jgi:hypothetical protein
MKIHERIHDADEEAQKLQEEKAATKRVKDMPEYGEIRVPKTWKKPPALLDLKHDIEGAILEHDLIVAEIETHLAYYDTTEGIGRPKKIEGRSNAQPRSIRKAAEWRYANLSEPFLDSPNMFRGYPTTAQDIEGTKQSLMVLNFQMRHKIDVVDFIDNYIKDLVDTGTAIIRTYWEVEELKREVDMDVVEYVPAPQLAETYATLMQLAEDEPETFKQQVPPEVALTLKKSMEAGQALLRKVIKTEKTTIVETIKNQPVLEVCDFRTVLPDPTCKGKQEKMKFCGFKFRTTKADLRADPRYFNIDKITNTGATTTLGSQSTTAVNNTQATPNSETFKFKDENRQPLEGVEYWGFVDVDDSGTLTPVVIAWVNDVIIRAEENPFPDKKIPFTFVPYLKKRNSLYGDPDGLLLQEDQKISGAITRGVVDILAKNANGQRGMPKNALDFANLQLFKKGKDYEFNPTAMMGRDGLAQITKFPEISQSAIVVKEMAEASIREITGTGAQAPSQSHGGAVAGSPPIGITGMPQSARRELGILRRIAQGIVQVGKKITAMNKEFLDDEEIVRITDDEFAVIKRDTLDCRYDLSLSISTAEDDAVKAQELSFLLQTANAAMDQGFTREILADIAELRRMPEKANKYRKYQPPQDPNAQREAELKLALLEAKVREINAIAAEREGEAAREHATTEKLREETRLIKNKADQLDLDFVEQETGLKHNRELEKQGAQANANMRLETHKAALEAAKTPPTPAPVPIENLQDNLTTLPKAGKTEASPGTDVASAPTAAPNTKKAKPLVSKSADEILAEIREMGTTRNLIK